MGRGCNLDILVLQHMGKRLLVNNSLTQTSCRSWCVASDGREGAQSAVSMATEDIQPVNKLAGGHGFNEAPALRRGKGRLLRPNQLAVRLPEVRVVGALAVC